jgi:hypothetical protein
MKVAWKSLLILSPLIGFISLTAQAADHIDSAAAQADATADITDVFAWMDADATKLALVMNVHNGAATTTKFSDAVQYVFHVNSAASYGATKTEVMIICTFDTANMISCWAGNEYLKGDASVAAGIASSSGKLKVFAGLRNDPFVFNLTGFSETAKIVHDAAASLSLDANGCPDALGATADTLVAQLGSGKSSAAAADDFASNNVLSIVVEVDKTLVNSGGEILGVWASTHK